MKKQQPKNKEPLTYEEINEKMNAWLDKQGYDMHDKYFIFKGLTEDVWELIRDADTVDVDEDDFDLDLDEEFTESEDVGGRFAEPVNDNQPKANVVRRPQVRVNNHGSNEQANPSSPPAI